ncbi:MAG: AmmeMemoRadiSam system radical SAM enzyme [Candidatus Methanospirare jalkutatii]|nr:AmmeMemoRadiSam system radical SAM enzyme [Candidatus Methanospirare jalkutatii]
MLKEAMLYTGGEKCKCNVCAHKCLIAEGNVGVCGTRKNIGGKLHTLIYGSVSSVHADPVEKKPLYHFHPGSFVLSLGTVSCNFRCKHCQNWSISAFKPGEVPTTEMTPEEVISQARATHCEGIAFTYNEPTIWFEFTYDTFKAAKRSGLYTVYVTNGYMSEEALNEISPFLDAANVDVKAFSEDFYRKICNAKLRPVLDTCERMHEKGIHLEVTYLIIPKYNDSDEELRAFARWLVALDAETPVHFSRFYPTHLLTEVPPTPVSTLERAASIAKEEGLEFVYLGNVPGHEYENTYCPDCGELLVKRTGYYVKLRIKKPICSKCGRKINIKF